MQDGQRHVRLVRHHEQPAVRQLCSPGGVEEALDLAVVRVQALATDGSFGEQACERDCGRGQDDPLPGRATAERPAAGEVRSADHPNLTRANEATKVAALRLSPTMKVV